MSLGYSAFPNSYSTGDIITTTEPNQEFRFENKFGEKVTLAAINIENKGNSSIHVVFNDEYDFNENKGVKHYLEPNYLLGFNDTQVYKIFIIETGAQILITGQY